MNLYQICGIIAAVIQYFFVVSSDATVPVVELGLIPKCVFGVDSVSYILYTRSHPEGIPVQKDANNVPLRFGSVGIVIHGFIAQANGTNFFELIHNWLSKEDINIFSVNWDDAACSGGLKITDVLAYQSAVKNVPVVGEDLAKFTVSLAQKYGVDLTQIVIYGHSLGAHVAGFAGKNVQRLAGQKYKVIVGLDPAGPSYRGKECGSRLCVSDANYVEAFHTSRLLGYHDPIAVSDFYFHGGTRQRGCILTTCDHSKSVIYAGISIANPHCFLATRWELDSSNVPSTRSCNPTRCAYAGLDAAQHNVRGTFYVSPSSQNPYCSA